ncbi:hypothetical protein SY83_00715 [Paenibacillus swuensis]|uniref:N-acetyltransferase domain-containing protein n=1 Tax=Paenibacillus swuensis TaxID=1178515 RepID=A0A172TDK1_9BACL|nr:GNAT family N-acetyltransferase [Paenibacillus swuensis]ANE45119.1 hypothetical protein SY83_00715 [Paenibacillus swuensis]
MHIRPLTADEFELSLELSEFAFQFEMTKAEREERKAYFEPERIWGCFEDDKLLAKLVLLPLETYIQQTPVAMGGIAGVATWPEYRRQGLVTQLLQHALLLMRENGQTLSFLHPFEFPFYRKYGWETYIEYKKYIVDAAKLPVRTAYPGTITRIKPDASRINPVYEAFAKRYNGTLVRSDSWWERSVFERKGGQFAVYQNAEGQDRGYILYKVKDKEMVIHEMVCLDLESEDALWSFVGNHDSMIEKVKLTAPADDRLPFKLRNPRITQETVPYFMGRIVDFTGFLGQYTFAPTSDLNAKEIIVLAIEDPFAPWNQGTFAIDISSEGKPEIASTDERPQLRMDIQTLSALFLGYLKPLELYQLGRIQGDYDQVQRLEQRIPPSTTYLMDFF